MHEAPAGHGADYLHADAARLDREAALHERAALSLGEDEARGHAGAVAEDRDLAAALEAIDDQVMRRGPERAFDDAAVAAALLEVRALDLEHLRPPLRMAVRVAHQLPDALDRRLDERLLGARPLHGSPTPAPPARRRRSRSSSASCRRRAWLSRRRSGTARCRRPRAARTRCRRRR